METSKEFEAAGIELAKGTSYKKIVEKLVFKYGLTEEEAKQNISVAAEMFTSLYSYENELINKWIKKMKKEIKNEKNKV